MLRKVERNAKEKFIFLFISETENSKLVSLDPSKNFGEANVTKKACKSEAILED